MLQSWARSALGLRAAGLCKSLARRVRFRNAPRLGGSCPLCGAERAFVDWVSNPRESPLCLGCGSVPRQRALASHLARRGVDLCALRVHESSPSLCTYRWFAARCGSYVASYYLPEKAGGDRSGRFVCVDLHDQPFPPAAFDLVVTLDVLEHLADPLRALGEIDRTLGAGGVHVFTVPRQRGRATVERAVLQDGRVSHRMPPEYHRDPVSKAGALVVTDWGADLEAILMRAGIECAAVEIEDEGIGVPAAVEVFEARRR